MSGSFPRTTRSLRADRAAPLALGLAVAGALALGWLGWSALARVPVRAVSRSARIEAAAEPRRIQAAVAGAVSAVEVGLGDPVQAGQLLIRLDDAAARSALADATSTRDALGHQLERLAEAREALSGAGSLDEAARRSAAAAARSKLDQVEVAARQAEEEAQRARELAASGAISAREVEQAEVAVERLRLETSVQRQVWSQLGSEIGGALQVSQVELGRIEQQLAELRGALASAEARVTAAEQTVRRHAIVAPTDGTVGALEVREPGAVVASGDLLVTVVPAGDVHVVATFGAADALGRIRPGQPARVRLDAFPWTTWGSVSATVARVADEPDPDGEGVRVELSIDGTSGVPLQHGLPGTVEVVVDRASPAALVLRAAGG